MHVQTKLVLVHTQLQAVTFLFHVLYLQRQHMHAEWYMRLDPAVVNGPCEAQLCVMQLPACAAYHCQHMP
jgi:hypothetical protein